MIPDSTLPIVDGESVEWWAAIAEGRLLLERCRVCGSIASYPRSFCTRCWSEDVEWIPAAGTGAIYTFSVVRVNDLAPFNERLPYVVAMVELDEGPRLMTSIGDVEPEDVDIGMRVAFRPRVLDEHVSAPEFVPIGRR